MKKSMLMCICLLSFGLLTACGSDTTKDEEKLKTAETSTVDSEELLTIKNSIIDNDELQIWYEFDLDDSDDAKNAAMYHVYLIKSNEIASLALDYPTDYDHTNEEHEAAEEKEPLTLGDISELKETDKIFAEVKKRYKNSGDGEYGQNNDFIYYPLSYIIKSDGSGNNTQNVGLRYQNKEGKEKTIWMYSSIGNFPVFDNYFAGYWFAWSQTADDLDKQLVTLVTDETTRYGMDEIDSKVFEIE